MIAKEENHRNGFPLLNYIESFIKKFKKQLVSIKKEENGSFQKKRTMKRNVSKKQKPPRRGNNPPQGGSLRQTATSAGTIKQNSKVRLEQLFYELRPLQNQNERQSENKANAKLAQGDKPALD